MRKKQNIIVLIAVVFIVGFFSISSYMNKQKVYVLSNEAKKDATLERNRPYNDSNNTIIKKIIVHIEGDVINPGVYELDADSRVFDAIDAAGGLQQTADRKKINLAKKIIDEEYIYIPREGEELTVGSFGNVPTTNLVGGDTKSNLININTASAAELTALPGIGEVLANRIIEHRTSKGSFGSIEDLKNVSGIGDRKFSDIKDKITVK